jgi:hypothetical protein
MTVVDQFLADAPQFLRNNHVQYKGQNPPTAGRYWFLLIPVQGGARRRLGVFLGKSIGKADAGAYEIRYRDASYLSADARRDGMPFEAQWSGYLAGGKAQCTLDSTGPGIMLTPELTGCAIAFSASPDGQARFSHYNLRTGNRTIAAAGMLDEARDDYAGARFGVLTKEQYYGKSTADMSEAGGAARAHARASANIIGWRKGGQWTFWSQYTDMKGQVRQILDVRQLAPGARTG